MGNPCSVQWLTVEFGRLDVEILGAVVRGFYDKSLALVITWVQKNRDSVEKGAVDLVFGFARSHGIETHGPEHVPGAGCAGIVVSGETPRGGGELHFQGVTNDRLGFAGRADIIIQPGNMKAGFVVGLEVAAGEKSIQLVLKDRSTAEQVRKAIDVVGHEKGVNPAIALAEVVGPLAVGRVEGLHPSSIPVLALHETLGGVKDVNVVFRPMFEKSNHIGLIQARGHLGDAPVVVSVFQGHGSGLEHVALMRNVAVFYVLRRGTDVQNTADAIVEILFVILSGALVQGRPQKIQIVVSKTLNESIGHNGNPVVAGHHPRSSRGVPSALGQPAALLENVKIRSHDVVDDLGL